MFAKREVLLDAKVLGPRLKGEFKILAGKVGQGDFTQKVDVSLVVACQEISRSEYSEQFSVLSDKEAAWSGTGLVLSVCLEISAELKLEGLARNLNRMIQDLRKQMNLAYDRRIILCVEADGEYG